MTWLAVHLPGALTIPAAVAVALVIGWYWRALNAERVPESRRRIRRASVAVMFMGVPILVVALSFADDHSAPTLYLVSCMFGLMAIFVMQASAPEAYQVGGAVVVLMAWAIWRLESDFKGGRGETSL